MTPIRRLFLYHRAQLSHPRRIPFHKACPNSPYYRAMGTEINASNAPAQRNNAAPAGPEQTAQGPLPLPEPPTDGAAIELDVSSGQGIKLDHLGPMVVNRDGTLSRIANWEHMADIERRNTLRILGKRNQLRMETLKAADGDSAAR